MDNTRKGVVAVELWLRGLDETMRLTLIGHPHRDMAGCRVEFTRRDEVPAEAPRDFDLDLPLVQEGRCGDISASQKRLVPQVSSTEMAEMMRAGKQAPTRMENTIYLEWFTGTHGRLVLEGCGMDILISEPQWQMTEEDERQAREATAATIQGYVDELSGPQVDVVEGREMDEFEWEEWLKERDRRTDALGELLEKFGHDTEGWDEAAKFMGWHQDEGDDASDDAELNADITEFAATDNPDEWRGDDVDDENEEDGVFESEDDEGFSSWESSENPIGLRVGALLDARRKLSPKHKPGDDYGPAEEFDFVLMKLRAKLAGALNGLEEEDSYRPERGMTIALLKRTLLIVDEGLALLESAAVPPQQKEELFAIREDILHRIDALRRGED